MSFAILAGDPPPLVTFTPIETYLTPSVNGTSRAKLNLTATISYGSWVTTNAKHTFSILTKASYTMWLWVGSLVASLVAGILIALLLVGHKKHLQRRARNFMLSQYNTETFMRVWSDRHSVFNGSTEKSEQGV